MADVRVIIAKIDGEVLDQFDVFRGQRPRPAFGSGELLEYTPELLSNDLRDYIEHKFEVTDRN